MRSLTSSASSSNDLEPLLEVTRQHLKSHIRGMRTLLTLLSELDSRLDRIAEEAERNGNSQKESSTPFQ